MYIFQKSVQISTFWPQQVEFDVFSNSDSVGASDVDCAGFYHLGLPRQPRLVCSAWKPRTPRDSCWERESNSQIGPTRISKSSEEKGKPILTIVLNIQSEILNLYILYIYSYLLWKKQIKISRYHSTSYFHISYRYPVSLEVCRL